MKCILISSSLVVLNLFPFNKIQTVSKNGKQSTLPFRGNSHRRLLYFAIEQTFAYYAKGLENTFSTTYVQLIDAHPVQF